MRGLDTRDEEVMPVDDLTSPLNPNIVPSRGLRIRGKHASDYNSSEEQTMTEWNEPSVKSPEEGDLVEIQIPGGGRVKDVEFSDGRFWKVRSGNGGQAYTVDIWRSREKRAETPKRVAVDGTD